MFNLPKLLHLLVIFPLKAYVHSLFSSVTFCSHKVCLAQSLVYNVSAGIFLEPRPNSHIHFLSLQLYQFHAASSLLRFSLLHTFVLPWVSSDFPSVTSYSDPIWQHLTDSLDVFLVSSGVSLSTFFFFFIISYFSCLLCSILELLWYVEFSVCS